MPLNFAQRELSSNSPVILSPHDLTQHVPTGDWLVLLDIDGTLSEFHPDPQQSFIPPETLAILDSLQRIMPVWLVTGRSLVDARRLCAPLDLPIIAQHGLMGWQNGHEITLTTFHTDTLLAIKREVNAMTAHQTAWLVEDKPCSVALHTRACPHLSDEAATIMQRLVTRFSDWQLQVGRYVWEIMPRGISKGSAIERLLAEQYPSRRAVFIGDDVGDESGFVAVQQRGGIGIKVAHHIGVPSTQARFFVRDVPAVAVLLTKFAELAWQG